MSNEQNNTGGIGLAVAALVVVAVGFFFLLVFIALATTIVAVLAWFTPVQLGRRVVVDPADARRFVGRGIGGSLVAFWSAVFAEAFLGIPINPDYIVHIVLVGYVAGSLGLEILMANDRSVTPPPSTVMPPSPRTDPGQSKPGRFASWDDEDEARR
jgi:hypothetical protein